MPKRALQQLVTIIVCLLLSLAAVSCNKSDNANSTNTGNTGTSTNPQSSQDSSLRNTVQANLSKYGVTGVTVEVSNGEVTLKGSIPRAKLQDAMKAANEANPKKVNNQMNIQ